jgi:hypothetical protein
MKYPHYGINRRELDSMLVDLGGDVIPLSRTGEVQYRHPCLSATPRGDGRRKDAPMHLVKFVRRVMDELGLSEKHQNRAGGAA